MDEDQKPTWRRFQRLRISKKTFRRHARKAEGATIRHAHKFIIGRWDNIRDVRRRIITWYIGIGILIGLVGIQVILFQSGYMMMAPIPGGVYAEAVKGPVDTLNPLYATSDAELAASHLLFSSLYGYDITGHLRADLATGTSVDATGKEYTVTLRPNAKWHDGTRVTATDVVFTVGLIKDPTTRAVTGLRSAWTNINVVAVNPYTVKFTLATVNAAFPQALTFAVLPQHVLGKIAAGSLRENSFSNTPVGSGPFQIKLLQLVDQAAGRKIVHMSAYPDYYRGAPKLNRFQLHVFGTNGSIMTALRTGEVSAAADIGVSDIPLVDKSHYEVLAKPVNSGVYALLNTTQPILNDKKVRQALQIGTDTTAIRHNVSTDLQPLELPFVSGQLSGDGIPRAPVYNEVQAKAALDADGWVMGPGGVRNKAGQALKLHVVTIKDDDFEHSLETLAGEWRKLGVDLQTDVVDPSDPAQNFAQDILQNRNYDVLIDRLTIGADPDVYAYWHSSQATPLGKNYSNYSNTTSDDALTGALSRREPAIRNAKYKVFAKQWLDDAPAIGLYQSNMYYVHSKTSETITDSEKVVSPSDRFGRVIYWTVDQGIVYKTP